MVVSVERCDAVGNVIAAFFVVEETHLQLFVVIDGRATLETNDEMINYLNEIVEYKFDILVNQHIFFFQTARTSHCPCSCERVPQNDSPYSSVVAHACFQNIRN